MHTYTLCHPIATAGFVASRPGLDSLSLCWVQGECTVVPCAEGEPGMPARRTYKYMGALSGRRALTGPAPVQHVTILLAD